MPPTAETSYPLRKRAKHTRSKLGCGVCRTRRVRCDRTRPACERCTKTGRQCDGYPLSEPTESTALTQRKPLAPSLPSCSLLRPRLDIALDAQECRALDYFRTKAAPELCVFFESDLWSNLVLRISRREACGRQIIHTSHASSNSTPSPPTTRQRAINEYGQGIIFLNAHISAQGWASLEITLLCSILCVTFEWLRGDLVAAHTHLCSSMSIMSQWNDSKRSSINRTSPSSPGGHMIRTRLGQLWTSLLFQARTTPTSSLQHARTVLDVLLTRRGKPWDIACRLTVLHRITEWSQNFTAFLVTQEARERERAQATILKLWHRTAHPLFVSSFSSDEIYFDGFLEEFTDVVTKTGELLLSPTIQFSVDIGIVPLLFYVALKCRHPHVRRRAVDMLQAAPRREAVRDSMGAASVVEEIVTDVERRMVRIKTLQQGC
ncbi:hypothetical protein EDB81DRAFT_849469 [Dactylonectria macrodidyma]|uniref:Zn(2)-C6 fungal-type domain-containing protein n=1 Tax=Dactylonectria macrodidyma TaxID=307937 RepID=A0A9P9I6G2_9HYPO|nr:hypothetical protein EDB81DRAFT_849469 [Dactylonectria macrodidyma]